MDKNILRRLLGCTFVVSAMLSAAEAVATVPTAFTYQGKLTDSGNLANGNYDMLFRLYDTQTPGTGTQQGGDQARTPVVVTAGVFTVVLDFGNQFGGAGSIFLEIGVRPEGSGNPYSILSQRQAITASPYAIQTLNASFLGGVPANKYLVTDGFDDVGLGITPSALSRLHVISFPGQAPPRFVSEGDVSSSASSAGVDFYHFSSRVGYVGVPDFSATGGNELMLFGASGIPVSLWANGARGMTLNTSGNVGIGTAGDAFNRLYVDGGSNPFGISVTTTASGGHTIHAFNNSSDGIGVYGIGHHGVEGAGDLYGVVGNGNSGDPNSAGVYGYGQYLGVKGTSGTGVGVKGDSDSSSGVYGISSSAYGVKGESTSSIGVAGSSTDGTGVEGASSNGAGVVGISYRDYGTPPGQAITSAGVFGQELGPKGIAVAGSSSSSNGVGVFGISSANDGFGMYARNQAGGWALFVEGKAQFSGQIIKAAGSFKIDHPLDPENKYLSHSFVESPDMKNIYDGNVTTDAQGIATVELPEWFEALNKDFRYQLTVIGTFARAVVASRIQDNRFTIATDQPNVEVSWQVTGIRKDRYAERNRIVVEEWKPPEKRGTYLHAAAFDHPESDSESVRTH